MQIVNMKFGGWVKLGIKIGLNSTAAVKHFIKEQTAHSLLTLSSFIKEQTAHSLLTLSSFIKEQTAHSLL